MTRATKNFGPRKMEWADIAAPSLWVLQSVHGSIHTVISGCEEKGEEVGTMFLYFSLVSIALQEAEGRNP